MYHAQPPLQGPYGYNADISGIMGATLLLAGVVAAFLTAPLFDRVFTHHLAITAKCLVPLVDLAWLSLIWAGQYMSIPTSHTVAKFL